MTWDEAEYLLDQLEKRREKEATAIRNASRTGRGSR